MGSFCSQEKMHTVVDKLYGSRSSATLISGLMARLPWMGDPAWRFDLTCRLVTYPCGDLLVRAKPNHRLVFFRRRGTQSIHLRGADIPFQLLQARRVIFPSACVPSTTGVIGRGPRGEGASFNSGIACFALGLAWIYEADFFAICFATAAGIAIFEAVRRSV
jgi:hypothetical protein